MTGNSKKGKRKSKKNKNTPRTKTKDAVKSDIKDKDVMPRFGNLANSGKVARVLNWIMGCCYSCFCAILDCPPFKWFKKTPDRNNYKYDLVPNERDHTIDIENNDRRIENLTRLKRDLEEKLQLAENEISQAEIRANDELKKVKEDYEEKLKKVESERTNEISKLNSLKKRLDTVEGEKKNLSMACMKGQEELKRSYNKYKEAMDKFEMEKKKLVSKFDTVKHQLDSAEAEKKTIFQRLKDVENQKDILNKEKSDALTRLSEVMGTKLRDNNPAITNLNDPNRPMKLGDQFSELYENEWTDVYSDLLDSKDFHLTERETIRILLDMLKEIYDLCLKDVAEQLSGHKKTLTGLSDDDIEDFMKAVKDSLKINAPKYVPLLLKKIATYCPDCPTVTHYKSCSLPYINSCVKICYFAVVQDPPMSIDFEPGHIFEKQLFKEYTRSGTTVEYLVWPALYLHKGGPILSKGVVQPHAKQTD